jgi:hypothetical protein
MTLIIVVSASGAKQEPAQPNIRTNSTVKVIKKSGERAPIPAPDVVHTEVQIFDPMEHSNRLREILGNTTNMDKTKALRLLGHSEDK